MLYEIKHKISDKVFFSLKTTSLKLCAEAAVKTKTNLSSADLSSADLNSADLRSADLRSADLCYADLSSADLNSADLRSADLCYANLSYANLRSADLNSADLRYADLSYANLSYADLNSADLRYADLCYANLSYANLSYADLNSADLRYADLRYADLSYANLRSADLRYAKGLNKFITTPLYILKDQPGKIRAYKLVKSNFEGIYNGGLKYDIGQTIEVENANTDEVVQCAAGINLATLDWCIKEWKPSYKILIVEFVAKDIAAIPVCSDGKFRVFQCAVVGEKDLKEIGLIE